MRDDAYACAVRLLARREHGAFELVRKLEQKGYSEEDANHAVTTCQRLGFQNDQRFSESLCRARVSQGYGPLRIQRELETKQVAEHLIHQALDQAEVCWLESAACTRQKKYGHLSADTGYGDVQKQKKFLYYRGFPMDVINEVFRQK